MKQAMKALALLMNSVRLAQGDAVADALLNEGRRMFHDEGSDKERSDVMAMLESQESLLQAQGEYGAMILQSAFTDGSSVMCRRCEGLVSRERWDAHMRRWCPKLPASRLGSEDDEDDDGNDDNDDVVRRAARHAAFGTSHADAAAPTGMEMDE